MATWTDTTTVKAGVTSGKPIIGIGGFGEQVPDNLQYLKDIIDQVGIAVDEAIHENFTGDALSVLGSTPAGTEEPYTWELGGTVPTLSGNPDHYINCSHNGGAGPYSVIAASQYKIRFDLSRDHTVVYEARHISGQSDATEVWAFGFQDAALGVGVNTIITDQTDFIGFRQGNANTYNAITASGGVTTTVASNVGNAANWTKLKAVVTFSGATQNVEFFIDDASLGTSISNISVIRMRPIFGCNNGAASPRVQRCDSIDAFWRVRPLSA
jgi:hypothetical protein